MNKANTLTISALAAILLLTGCASIGTKATMRVIDTNKDGKITQAEACTDSGSQSKEDCMKEFMESDLNGDGVVDKNEVKKGFKRSN